jgi:Spy/CpxP family protein refolding chaperone
MMTFKSHLRLSFSLLILLSSPAFSQPSGMRPVPGMEMRYWRGENRGYRASELNLSPEQAKELDIIQQAHFRETQLLRGQLLSKRLELREFLKNQTTRIETIRTKYFEINELESRFEEKAVDYLIKVRNLLTPEQLRSWNPEEEFPLFHRMMRGVEPLGPRPPMPMSPRRNPPPDKSREE